eukprot:PhF_6_TR10352/c3_g1_i1/m.16009
MSNIEQQQPTESKTTSNDVRPGSSSASTKAPPPPIDAPASSGAQGDVEDLTTSPKKEKGKEVDETKEHSTEPVHPNGSAGQQQQQELLPGQVPDPEPSGTTEIEGSTGFKNYKPKKKKEDIARVLHKGGDLNRGEAAGMNTVLTEMSDGPGKPPHFDIESTTVGVGDAVTFKWWHRHNLVQTESDYATKTMNGASSGDPIEKGEFTYVFDQPGSYHFVSECDKELHVTVNVVTEKSLIVRRGMKFMIAILLLVIVTGGLLYVLSSWMQQQDFLLPENRKVNDKASYEGQKEVRNVFLKYGFPWYAFSIILFIVTLVCRCVVACRSYELREFGRGFPLSDHKRTQIVVFFASFLVVALVMAFWGSLLNANLAFSAVMRSLSVAISQSVNEVLSVVDGVTYLMNNAATLLPGFVVPSTAKDLLKSVTAMSDDIKDWSDHGEEMFRAIFRLTAVVSFLGLQLVLYAASLGMAAAYRRNAKMCRTATWVALFGIMFSSMSIGTTWVVLEMVQRTYDTTLAFQQRSLTKNALQQQTGLGKDASMLKMIMTCAGDGMLSASFLEKVINDGINDINKKLKQTSSKSSVSTFSITLQPMNFSSISATELNTMVDYFGTQVAALDVLLQDPDTADDVTKLVPSLTTKSLPAVRTALTVARSMASLFDCRVIRNSLTLTLPNIKNNVIPQQRKQVDLLISIVAFLFILVGLGGVGSYVFSRPYKLWFCAKTERWFLFRCSYKAHIRILAAKGAPSRPLKWKSLRFTFQDLVTEFYLVNVVNCFMVLLQALLLIILNNSYSENRLSSEMQLVAMMCIAGPFVSLISASSSLTIAILKRILRFLATVAMATACYFSFSFVYTKTTHALDCYQDIRDNRRTNKTGYPFSSDCSIDNVMKDFEGAAYNSTIGAVCVTALITGIFVVFFVHQMKDEEKMFEKKQSEQTKLRRRRLMLALAVVTVIAFFIAGAVLVFGKTVKTESVAPGAFVLPREGCNGQTKLCGMTLEKIVWATVHNAHSSQQDGFITPNNNYNIPTQLNAGIRAIMIDIWNDTNSNGVTQPYLCHGVCSLGRTRLLDSFLKIEEFLRLNKTEVLIIHIEQYSNTQDIVKDMTAANLVKYVWKPTSTPASSTWVWPTLQSLIDTNQRLLVFTDVTKTNKISFNTPSWYLYQWDFFFETNYAITKKEEFTCRVNRGSATDDIMKRKISVLNQFMTNPVATPMLASQANDPDYVRQRFGSCRSSWSRVPNLVAVDFWDLGDFLQTIDDLNRDL